jgi:hypothetical protein
MAAGPFGKLRRQQPAESNPLISNRRQDRLESTRWRPEAIGRDRAEPDGIEDIRKPGRSASAWAIPLQTAQGE